MKENKFYMQVTPYPPDTSPNDIEEAPPLTLIHLLPNIFSLLSLGVALTGLRYVLMGEFDWAVSMLFIAFALAFIDRQIEGIIGADAPLDYRLNLLTDFTCFGVLPPLMLYIWQLHQLDGIGWAASLLITICIAMRVARDYDDENLQLGQEENDYEDDESEEEYSEGEDEEEYEDEENEEALESEENDEVIHEDFEEEEDDDDEEMEEEYEDAEENEPEATRFSRGIPLPFAGILLLLPMTLWLQFSGSITFMPEAALAYIVVIALLTVSRVATFSLANITIPQRYFVPVMIGLALVVVLFLTLPWIMISLACVCYLISIIVSVKQHARMLAEQEAIIIVGEPSFNG